jgi:hypothetical protein
MRTIKLWKYNRTTGIWAVQRICDPETANQWLKVFQDDAPHEAFILGKRQPKGKPVFPNYMYALGIA